MSRVSPLLKHLLSHRTHTKDFQPYRLYVQHAVVAFWYGGVMFILHGSDEPPPAHRALY
jgi:hypothetical protein